jgi:hypothetical protein
MEFRGTTRTYHPWCCELANGVRPGLKEEAVKWISDFGYVGAISNHVAGYISILGFVHDDERFLAACVRVSVTSVSPSQLETSTLIED